MFYDPQQAPTQEQVDALQLSPRVRFDGIGGMGRFTTVL